MKRIKFLLRTSLILGLQFGLLLSCKDSREAQPFPTSEHEYKSPITRHIALSKADTLNWASSQLRSFNSLPIKKFNFNKLPSKPFDIGEPFDFTPSRPDQDLDWDRLPSRAFDFDSLPMESIEFKTIVLGAPSIVKAGVPERALDASRGVMTFDGYPGTILCQMIDQDGMIWIGGSSGIARFDAEELQLYDQGQGLKSNTIFSIYQDSKGRIWTGDSEGSISIIDLKANLIYELSSLRTFNPIYDITEAKDGKFWLSSTGKGYGIIDLADMSLRTFSEEQGLLDKMSVVPMQDAEGLIWLTTGKGVNIVDPVKGTNTSLTQQEGLPGKFVVTLFQDRLGNIWVGSEGGAAIINKERSNISYITTALSLPDKSGVMDFFQDASDNIWIGTDEGTVFKYDQKSSRLEQFFLKRKVGNQNDIVFGINEDRQGQLWFPILGEGIFLLNPEGGRPGNFTKQDGIESIPVWSTLEAGDGKIWIGGENGIDVFDPEEKKIYHLGKKDGLIEEKSSILKMDSQGRIWSHGIGSGVNIIDTERSTIQQFGTFKDFQENWISAMLEDSNGNYWFGGTDGKLFLVDVANELIKEVVLDTMGNQHVIDNIIEDVQHRIWVSGRGIGIHILDPTHQFRSRLGTEQGLISDNIYAMFKDEGNHFWTGTVKGVERIDLEQNKVWTFTTEQGLAANDVYDIIQDRDKIFLGTSKGLTILEPETKGTVEDPEWNAVTLNKRQGLDFIDFNMGSFSFDSKGRFWAGVESEIVTVMDKFHEDTTAYPAFISGISIFDKKQNFYDKEAVMENLHDQDTIWTWDLNDYRLTRRTEIDSMTMNSGTVTYSGVSGPYRLPNNLRLPFDQNYLSFNYNAVQFSNADKVVYRYLLEGIDKTWSPISPNTKSENYRDLPPGDYTFKVSSKGFNGIWSKPAELSFTILPPWWQTWWAYTIFAVLFLGLGLVILHYRSRWLKKENRILEERVNERTAELKKTIDVLENTQSQLIQSEKMASLGELTAGIAHEIQNPMNFINNFSEVTIELVEEMCQELVKGETIEAMDLSKDIVQNLEKITHHGKRASSIVKGMLEHSRNSSGQMEYVDINVLADEYLRLAYHGLRAKDKSFNADFRTDFDESLPKVQIIPQDLGRVLLNIINNAFFAVTSIPEEQQPEGFKPLVVVSTKNMSDQVLISIKDNGPGIPAEIKEKIFQPFFTTKPTGKGTGLGLSLAYDIVTTGHGGAIELNTAPGEGTEFVIYIPIKE